MQTEALAEETAARAALTSEEAAVGLAAVPVLQGGRDGVSLSEGRRHEAIMSAAGSFPQAGASGQERRKGELLL